MRMFDRPVQIRRCGFLGPKVFDVIPRARGQNGALRSQQGQGIGQHCLNQMSPRATSTENFNFLTFSVFLFFLIFEEIDAVVFWESHTFQGCHFFARMFDIT